MLKDLSQYVHGVFPMDSDENKTDYSEELLKVLLGESLPGKILLNLSQAEIGRKFLAFKEDDKFILNDKASLGRWLIRTFKYMKRPGEYADLTKTIYRKYLVG